MTFTIRFPLASHVTKVVVLVVAIVSLGAIVVITRLEIHQALQQILARRGKDIVYNAFGSTLDRVIGQLGEPYQVEKLRESEQLAYWDYSPTFLQVHFNRGKVSRMAYFFGDADAADDRVREIFEEFGGNEMWQVSATEIDGEKKLVMVNRQKRLTLVTESHAIFVYGYLFR